MKYRIFHSQRECPIRRRYGRPAEDDTGAHLSFRNTKVGEALAVECRFCYFIRSRKEAGQAGEGHCTHLSATKRRNAA